MKSGYSTHNFKTPTRTVNGFDFILLARTQAAEDINDCMAYSRWRPTPHFCKSLCVGGPDGMLFRGRRNNHAHL